MLHIVGREEPTPSIVFSNQKVCLKTYSKNFYPDIFLHKANFFPCFGLFHATLLMRAPMISLKVIVECPDLSAKKHSKKENPIRRGGSTQCRGMGLFKMGSW